jgi:hypothetical protein
MRLPDKTAVSALRNVARPLAGTSQLPLSSCRRGAWLASLACAPFLCSRDCSRNSLENGLSRYLPEFISTHAACGSARPGMGDYHGRENGIWMGFKTSAASPFITLKTEVGDHARPGRGTPCAWFVPRSSLWFEYRQI